MSTNVKLISTLAVGSLISLGTLSSLPATAAILTWDFTYQPTQGMETAFGPGEEPIITELSGPFSTYTGSFSYDDSLLTKIGAEELDISATLTTNLPNFNLRFDVKELAEYNAIASFQNGYLVNISTLWEPCYDDNACNLGGYFVGQRSGSGLLSVYEAYLGGPYFLRDYLGDFNLTKQVDVKIPEPSLVWGLVGFSLVGLLTRRKNLSQLTEQ